MSGSSNGHPHCRWRAVGLIAGAAFAASAIIALSGAGGGGGFPGAVGSVRAAKPPLPIVRGHAESCLGCHDDVRGIEPSHAPSTTGCAACHGGDPASRTAAGAHSGLVRIPGNLENALQTCGQAGCHDTVIPRIGRSVMTTMAGVVAVDRMTFGELPTENPHVMDLGNTAADSHLRQLCASCHLGQAKDTWGPVTESSRGGGCNGCHLGYTAEAARELAAYTSAPPTGRRSLPAVHPTLTVNVDGTHCFGCHSRSSRISTSYEGWHELAGTPAAARAPSAPTRRLEDGRTFVRAAADVHHERGLDCIDCHPANEVMGKGVVAQRKAEQVGVRCEDCHQAARPAAAVGADPESQVLLALRGWTAPAAGRIAATRAGDPLIGVAVDVRGRVTQRLKTSGKVVRVVPEAVACNRKAHERLTCDACHTAWAPRCASCHTSFDPVAEGYDHLDRRFVPGAWQETAGTFEPAAPTLGVREDARPDAPDSRTIDTFVPGMILELDRNRDPAWPPDAVSRRWYARIAAHTTRREVRSCGSCHSDPVALGYGRGTLRFNPSPPGTGGGSRPRTGTWVFTPDSAPLDDGLPPDAWTGFLHTRTTATTARGDARPFTAEEQARILRVGTCLSCHDGSSAVMTAAVDDFGAVLHRRTPACIDWMPEGWAE